MKAQIIVLTALAAALASPVEAASNSTAASTKIRGGTYYCSVSEQAGNAGFLTANIIIGSTDTKKKLSIDRISYYALNGNLVRDIPVADPYPQGFKSLLAPMESTILHGADLFTTQNSQTFRMGVRISVSSADGGAISPPFLAVAFVDVDSGAVSSRDHVPCTMQ